MTEQIPETLAGLAVDIDSLTPYGRNPRRGDLAAIVESLRVNGQYRPVVVRKGTGEILAGNHTVAAARQLGWKTIAATFVEATDEQAARIVLVDNRSNDLAGYDDGELLALLEDLPDLDGTGYDQAAVDELIAVLGAADERPALTDPDDVPAPPRPTSKVGDVWLLGSHRLAVGDGTDPDVAAAACGGRLADAYITDPPYNVNYTGGTADALTIENDNMTGEEFRALLTGLFSAALPNVKPGGPVYTFYATREHTAFELSLHDAGWEVKQQLVWVKHRFVLSRQDHHWQHEAILYGWKPGAAHSWYGGRTLTTLIDEQRDVEDLTKDELRAVVSEALDYTTAIRHDAPHRNDTHPTMKPVGLIERLIERSTRTGETVLDTCAGSGSALIACHGTGRRAALVELDPVYADVICRRWQEHTGIAPVLEATGETADFTVQDDDAA